MGSRTGSRKSAQKRFHSDRTYRDCIRFNQSVTDSSILYLTRGGESSEDIISGLKKNRQKIMKALIPVSPKKKLGIITTVKWTIQNLQHQ
jgi:hypothetical protein